MYSFSHAQRRILALLLCSGFCALTYEILWAKQLALTLGSSINAISIVTATFMVGLGSGSYCFGRLAGKTASPFRLYALLEIGVFFFAATFPAILAGSENLYVALHLRYPDWPGITTTLRLAIAALLLLPPTFLMGGTLPAIARFHRRRQFSGTLGRMYAVNTLGGVLGCFCCGFFLIPRFGLSGTNTIALAVNGLLVAAAFAMARRPVDGTAAAGAPQSEMSASIPPLYRALPFIALAGALSMALEILWTRLLVLMLGNTTYAFSSILAVFLLGLAIGGWIYALVLRHGLAPRRIYLSCLLWAGLFILITHTFYDQLAHLFLSAHTLADGNWWLLSQLNLGVITLVLTPPAIAFGIALPAGMALIAPSTESSSRAVGLALAWNTGGAVTGSLLAGFVLLPQLGLHASFNVCLAALFLTCTLFLLLMRPLANRLQLLAMTLLLLILSLIPTFWNPMLMNSGVYVYSHYYRHNGGLEASNDQFEILDVVEGKETTVAVYEDKSGIRTFRVNGKTDGSTGPDMLNQVLAAQLPLLIHPQPETALVVGLGTGITLGEVLTHPIEHADCIEISPEVVAIASHFDAENGGVLYSPRAHIQVMDGRNFLLTTPKAYDVIISEPSNPWQTGNANLFTYEFYALVRKHLNPGGLFCQWIPMYDLDTDRLAVAFKTFAEQFEEVRVFRIGAEVIMLGSRTPIDFDRERVAARMQREPVATSLQRFEVTAPADLISKFYYCNRKLLLAFAEDAHLNHDRQPILEYAQVQGEDRSRVNIQALERVRQRLGAEAVN